MQEMARDNVYSFQHFFMASTPQQCYLHLENHISWRKSFLNLLESRMKMIIGIFHTSNMFSVDKLLESMTI